MVKEKGYDDIELMKGLEAVRKLPSLYLGDVGNGDALHHSLWEIVSNSIDEFMNGFCNKISVSIFKDGSASVLDNGRGIPVAYNKEEKKSSLELALSSLHSSGKFGKENYKYSSGLHGVGASCVNGVSDRFKVIVWRNGKEYSMSFERGKRVEDLTEKSIKGNKTGTFIRFAPDITIFKNITTFDPEKIRTKLKEVSFLCSGLEIEFCVEANNTKEVFPGETNISDFVKYLAEGNLMAEPILINGEKDKVKVDVSLQWKESFSEEVCKCYTNNIPNTDGGTHLVAFRNALTRTINTYIEQSDLPKTYKISLSGDNIRDSLVSVISIWHPDAKFSSQTKDKLVSDDVRGVVESIVSQKLFEYLEKNPVIAKKIVGRAIDAHKAAEAAKKAREAIRKTTMNDGVGVLPGKLADCSSKNPDECELFICEGASAGGSLKMARDRNIQAILPLRGKILNVEKADYQKLIKSEELINIITVLGVGIGRQLEIEKLRYGKIIFATDADVDGLHLITLLLTFFFRQMPQLILNGNIYISQPPLYRVDYRNNAYYIKNEEILNNFIAEKRTTKNSVKIQRFKGLGEMPVDSLWETVVNPETRTLLQVRIDNPLEADKTFSILMGDDVEPRKEFIISNSKSAKLDV